MTHIADNHDALLDYLYEEGDPAERLKIAEHLQECAACSIAVLEFQSVRGMLSQWAPPASELGFKIVQDAPAPPRRAFWAPARVSTFAQLAAGILLFVAGVAVSQVRVRYADGAITVSTRPAATAAPSIRNASITLPAQTVRVAGDVDIDQLERELRARLQGQNASSVDTELLLQRVRAMIDQSEQRQQRELALRLSQVAREVDTQHQADMLKIQQDFGQQQDATMEYLVRTSGGAK
jgi:anti-sigma factor RsiW